MDSAAYAVRDDPDRRRFEIDLGGGAVAIAEYRRSDGRIAFTHTAVPPSHRSQGLGTMLIEAALAAAREAGLKVVPTCPFFAAYMKKHSETHDMLDPASRRKLGLD
jgi:uncharacterized protein